MVTASSVRLLAATLLAAAAVISAQVVPSSSTDPLQGQTFTTPYFQPTITYEITTTYSTNTPYTSTVITGSAGASPATAPYSYTYSPPINSASGTDESSLLSSLAANGQPTQATSALQPDVTNLQFANGAYAPSAYDTVANLGLAAVAGVFGALWIL